MSTPFYSDLPHLHEEIVACRACHRLVDWREKVAREKRRMYSSWTYWGKPVPGFGDPAARIVFVGLAPAAHGANRTGRMFTGDRSGDFLFAALHRAGLANQPTSTSKEDGLALKDTFIVAPVRCAPPDNQPLPEEITACQPFLDRELALLPHTRVLIALGAIAWDAVLRHLERRGLAMPRPRPKFGHGACATIEGAPLLLGSFHVSQQNTQTGRLTPAMFDQVLAVAKRTVGFDTLRKKNSKP
ncbi:uracil-DNA glycosylase [Pendulispora rubella]|uniref:Type-5 uracil-DNA glycosylase n=1 Tax=Pendulispora rubella TaxID=2741070 RepID=A0ABZ2LG35_9BACT